jgi:hypothetical protein
MAQGPTNKHNTTRELEKKFHLLIGVCGVIERYASIAKVLPVLAAGETSEDSLEILMARTFRPVPDQELRGGFTSQSKIGFRDLRPPGKTWENWNSRIGAKTGREVKRGPEQMIRQVAGPQ